MTSRLPPGVRHLGISGYDTETHKLAIDLPEFGLWLDPPPPEQAEQPDQSQIAAGPSRGCPPLTDIFRFCFDGDDHEGSEQHLRSPLAQQYARA